MCHPVAITGSRCTPSAPSPCPPPWTAPPGASTTRRCPRARPRRRCRSSPPPPRRRSRRRRSRRRGAGQLEHQQADDAEPWPATPAARRLAVDDAREDRDRERLRVDDRAPGRRRCAARPSERHPWNAVPSTSAKRARATRLCLWPRPALRAAHAMSTRPAGTSRTEATNRGLVAGSTSFMATMDVPQRKTETRAPRRRARAPAHRTDDRPPTRRSPRRARPNATRPRRRRLRPRSTRTQPPSPPPRTPNPHRAPPWRSPRRRPRLRSRPCPATRDASPRTQAFWSERERRTARRSGCAGTREADGIPPDRASRGRAHSRPDRRGERHPLRRVQRMRRSWPTGNVECRLNQAKITPFAIILDWVSYERCTFSYPFWAKARFGS